MNQAVAIRQDLATSSVSAAELVCEAFTDTDTHVAVALAVPGPSGASTGSAAISQGATSAPKSWCIVAASEQLRVWIGLGSVGGAMSAPAGLGLLPGPGSPTSASGAAGLPAEVVTLVEAALFSGVRAQREVDRLPGQSRGGPLRVECKPWILSGDRMALLVFNDQGELHSLRRRLEQIKRAESLGMLAGSVAHDFNNLLTGIRGSLALVRHHITAEGRANALAAADLAAQRAGEVTRRLLTFSRGPERVQRQAEPFRVLQETVDLMRCIPDATRVDTDIDTELGFVDMLPSELHQVVLNLLINASDAVRSRGAASGVTLRASTTWRARASGAPASRKWLRVSVIDQGPGMDPELRQRIFEPFFTTKGEGKGTGLGLCSVKDLVESAGGWLEVESEIARGSAFHVYLPLTGDGNEAPPPSAQQTQRAKRVLICDDAGRIADLTVGLLEEYGFEAQAVVRGEEALGAFASPNAPHVMLLDVNLCAGLSAQQVLDELQRRRVSVAVILSSGLSQEDVPLTLRQHPWVVSYLAKPYTVEDLVAAIGAALEVVR